MYELKTRYDTADLYDLLEIVDARDTLKEVAQRKAKAEMEKNKPTGKRGR